MVIFKKAEDIKEYLYRKKAAACKTGFVPTLGALHTGHLALIEKAKADGLFAICSIFVNPTQFNDKPDLGEYPVSIEEDIALLINSRCDVLFLPSIEEIYPGGTDKIMTYDFGYLDTILEGAKRPGHFKGVGQAVGRLLEITEPNLLYMGQKDYQQCMIVRKLIAMMGLTELNMIICPTTRVADGLAMSSRNRRLTETQRAVVGCIYQCLLSIESKQDTDDFNLVKHQCEELLTTKGFIIDYVALADARDLVLLNNYKKETPMVVLIAATIGSIRLIDNMILNGAV